MSKTTNFQRLTYLDVNDVSDLVHLHVGGQWDDSALPEGTGEHIPRTSAITFRVCHCEYCKWEQEDAQIIC